MSSVESTPRAQSAGREPRERLFERRQPVPPVPIGEPAAPADSLDKLMRTSRVVDLDEKYREALVSLKREFGRTREEPRSVAAVMGVGPRARHGTCINVDKLFVCPCGEECSDPVCREHPEMIHPLDLFKRFSPMQAYAVMCELAIKERCRAFNKGSVDPHELGKREEAAASLPQLPPAPSTPARHHHHKGGHRSSSTGALQRGGQQMLLPGRPRVRGVERTPIV